MRLPLFGLLCAALISSPSFAQDCSSVADDKAAVERDGIVEYLGVKPMPFSDGAAVFYRTKQDITIMSPILDGCVLPQTYPVGRFKAEVGA